MKKIIIIGSGCAGYTAAVYAARAGLSPLLISGTETGGQLMLTSEIENFPGFPEGIMGAELMEKMRAQAERFGTEIWTDVVGKVDLSKRPFKVTTENGRAEEAGAIIIATGATAKWLGIETEKKFFGKGVSACAVCDGAFYRGKEVATTGGGDTAMEEAMFLTKFASKVTLIHRRDEFRASRIMQERVRKNPKITLCLSHIPEEVIGEGTVTGVKVKSVKDGSSKVIPCAGFFVAIGHQPNTRFLEGQVRLNEAGYILTEHNVRTSVPGVFAAGDVMDPYYRQAISAAGTGCMAALEAERFLESQE